MDLIARQFDTIASVACEFKIPHVEAGYNTSTVALRVLEDDEKGTRCVGVQLGHPLTGVTYTERPGPPGWGMDARLPTLLCKELLLQNPNK
jgi:hypothetical protein